MSSTTRMPVLDPVDPKSDGAPRRSGPRAAIGRVFELGLGDLRALGRSLSTTLRLVARRCRRAGRRQELEVAYEELGRIAAELPIASSLPARAAVLDQRAAREAALTAAEEARRRLRTAESEFTSRQGEWKSILSYLEVEENGKRRALAAAEASAGAADAAPGAPGSDHAREAAVAGLRQSLDEVLRVRSEKEARWREQETDLRGVQREQTRALEEAGRAEKAAFAALGPAHRALGREFRAAGLRAPAATDALARVVALEGDCRQDDSVLGYLGANLRADRFRMLRALAVVLGLLVVVLLAWPGAEGARRSGSGSRAETSAAAAVPLEPDSAIETTPPAVVGDFPSEALKQALLALPALADPDARLTWRFDLLERRPVAGGLLRLLIVAELDDPETAGPRPRRIQLSILVDDEDRIVETDRVRPVNPEDDELFRLLEERS